MDNKGLFKLLKLDNLIEHLSGYVEDKIDLVKIELKEELALAIAKIIITMVMVVFVLFALLFASITLAIYLNTLLQSNLAGYGIVASFYLVLFIIVFLAKKHPKLHTWIEQKVKQISSSKI